MDKLEEEFRGWWQHWAKRPGSMPRKPIKGLPPNFPEIGKHSNEWWLVGNAAWRYQNGNLAEGYIWLHGRL